MYVLRTDIIDKVLRRKGILGVNGLARRIGVHRNTLGRYLSQGEPVLPNSVSRVLDELELSPGEVICRVLTGSDKEVAEDAAIEIADQLVEAHPTAAYVLFGSRARDSARRYSDIDLGVFSQQGLETNEYLQLLDIKERSEDELPWFVDLVNLNNANEAFLRNIAPDLRFLGGRRGDWKALQRRCHGRNS